MTLQKPLILAIDDTPSNLLMLGVALEPGFDLQIATSGAAGLALAAQTPPDLILLDIMMPEMDGFEVCRRLKANPALQDIPVVFVSALTEIESESTGFALGAADYITKPINVEIARQRIHNLVEREALRKSVMQQRDQLQAQVAELDAAQHVLKQTQTTLAASEAFKLHILNSLSEEITVIDHTGVIQAVNEPWWRFAYDNPTEQGTLADHIGVGGNYLEVCRKAIHLGDPDANIASDALQGIQGVLDGSLPGFTLEYPCHSPTQPRWFSMAVSPLQQSTHRGAVIAHTNITERKVAQEKLQLAASVFTHAREGITITTTDGKIVEVNDAFSRITGYSRDEVLGQNPRLLKSDHQSGEFYAHLWAQLTSVGYWHGEIWNRRKNGELYAEMLTITAVCDAAGKTEHYVALFSDITALKAHEDQLDRIAHYDALTNLPNRVLLADRLRHGMAIELRRGKKLAVAFLDLDGFKAVNDTHGHEAGDQLLITLTARMKHTLREGDTLARIGGDEFVAVLGDLDDASACVPMLSRLLSAASQPLTVNGALLQVSASVGVTYYPQSQDVEPDQLLRQADHAMYQAKLAGKNRYSFFDAEQDSGIRSLHQSIERFRQALAQHELVLHYQPKVNMRTGVVIGAEALVRWQFPGVGLLAPGQFLPIIENHPLAVELGEWVINAALTQMAVWQAQGMNMPVSVNVSARQLQQSNFVQRLQEILAAHPEVAPSCLEIEILETSALEDLAGVSQVIEACRELGVMFAMDDFGTGYSSLTYLRRLRVNLLKIDQSFVHEMLDDVDDLAILQGVIGLAKSFQRDVIAEGVETVAHGSLLLQMGCELAQGYSIARPMPAHEMADWLAQWKPNPVWSEQTVITVENLPLLYAGMEHRAWVSAMGRHLDGERPAPPPLNLKQCNLGKWLDGVGRVRYGTQSAFVVLTELHQKIHALSMDLVALREQGCNAQALSRWPELERLRDALLAQLEALAASSP
jgi:diguanylate cyclase (GGDEF)-like protein/PAS domain S-box-containing protein